MPNKKQKKHTTYIYNIDKKVLLTVDALAKESNMSRSSWIKSLIENNIALNDFKKYEDRYTSLIEKQGMVIQNNTNAINRIMKMLGDE